MERGAAWRCAAVLVAATSVLVAGCTDGAESVPDPPAAASPTADLTVALVLAPGGPDDAGVNAGAIDGLERSVEAGVVASTDTEVFETDRRGSDRRAVLARAADAGAGLVIAVGPAYSRAVDEIRTSHRRQLFAIVGGDAEPAPNVANLSFAINESGFVAGAVAAMKSKTGTVGFVGGEAGTGLIERAQAGFEAGAREVDPEVEIVVSYLGETPDAFADPGAARAAAAAMFAGGADVVAHQAGASGVGVFEAASQALGLAVGSGLDETAIVPDDLRNVILTSIVDRVDVAVDDTIRAAATGTFVGGFHAYGLAEGGIDYAVNDVNAVPRLLSDPIRLRLDELIARVATGEIVVPTQPQIAPEVPGVPTGAPSVAPTSGPTAEPTGAPSTPSG